MIYTLIYYGSYYAITYIVTDFITKQIREKKNRAKLYNQYIDERYRHKK